MTDYLAMAKDAAQVPKDLTAPNSGNGHNTDTPAVTIEREAPHYELTEDNRMVLVKPPEQRSVRGQIVTIPETQAEIANFSARIVREVRRLDGEALESVYTVKGYWQWPFEVEVGADEFREERKARSVIGAVAGHGAAVKSLAHFPLAIQALSTEVERETRYLSTGWQDVNGKLMFVTPALDGVGVCEVDTELQRYCVAPGDTAKGLDALVNGLLEAFDHRQTYFVIAHAFLAPLYRWMASAKRYVLHLVGETGSLKTAFCCATMCLYGRFGDEEPTEKWTSTIGKIERLGHMAKDVLFLLDDYKARYVRLSDVTSLIQNYSESRGRGRLNRDASIKKTYWIRGALLSTGEDLPEGEASVISRMLIVHLSRPQGTNERLRYAQNLAPHLPAVMYDYTQWLTNARTQDGLALDQSLLQWQDEYMARCPVGSTNPGRLALNLAQSKVGFSVMAKFLQYMGQWTETEAAQRLAEFDGYAGDLLTEMAGRIQQEKASNSFLTAVRALLDSGRAELLPRDSKQEPSQGKELLGWKDGQYIYLLADASYHAAEQWYRQMGGSIGFSRQAIHAQLVDDGVMEPGKDKASTVIRVGDRTARVLKLQREAIEEAETEERLPF